MGAAEVRDEAVGGGRETEDTTPNSHPRRHKQHKTHTRIRVSQIESLRKSRIVHGSELCLPRFS